ncbi:MAG: hypothetical protein KGS72_01180 [Cyanobacteria bacterium REEB67]|nr:hypothetical protein [Cyanobacteria bacterium REEB67]
MATLRSEDRDFESSVSIIAGQTLSIEAASAHNDRREKQLWQMVELKIKSGERELVFSSEVGIEAAAMKAVSPEELQDAVENATRVANAYLICREPTNELTNLAVMLEEIADGARTRLSFEPSEPSFELTINNVAGGLRVDFFVDAGNVETGIYRWDSLGVRFFTSAANLRAFVDDFRAEFAC